MRREAHHHLAAGGQRELLVELGHVPVMADAIGVKALRDFGEQHLLLRRPARPGHARLGIDHDLVRHDRLGLEQRRQRKLRAARVAARVGDEPRLPDRGAMHLDQAIDRLASGASARDARGRTTSHRPRHRAAGSRPRGPPPWSSAPWPADRSITFCVVACGSAQNARSSPAFFQSRLSIETSFGSLNGENCGNTARISCPARRSAVSSASSTWGWRSSRRTSSEPV